MSSSSLSVTVAHAVSFLTRPLAVSYSATTIIKLRMVLEANLTALYAPSWVLDDPLRGSGRRCLTLSPDCLPPRAVYAACIASSVQWFDWISLLGGREFDLFVDPGCVSIRNGRKGQLITVWADEIPSPTVITNRPKILNESYIRQNQAKPFASHGKTLAQQLLEDDVEEDEKIFALIADEVGVPSWVTPTVPHFPASVRSSSPLSVLSTHSRSSSRSSNSSSCFSYASADSYDTTTSSVSSAFSNKANDPTKPKLSRRERARQARVYVDTSKTDVTPYDGGKTTVLTGGVMLGGAPKAKTAPRAPLTSSGNWRSIRV